MPTAGDVVEVMNRVVDEVPGEGLDDELAAVAAAAPAGPLVASDGREPGGG
jgi:hypothetical protein